MAGSLAVSDRHQLHLAAQIAGAFARTFVPEQPRWQHIALRLDEAAWVTAPAGDIHLAVLPDEAAIQVRGADTTTIRLTGKTLEHVGLAIDEALAHAGIHEGLALPALDRRPDHEVSRGAPFTLGPKAGLGALHAAAFDVLGLVAREHDDADPVLMWPHHFDVSFARQLGGDRAMTVGMSPGDGSYDDPYWYVTPWPYPDGALPALAAGAWHNEGWTGAVLPVGSPEPATFLREAQRLLTAP